MGFTSQSGQVAFREQSVADTFPADFATKAVGVRVRSGGLGPNRDLLIPDPEIGGSRDVPDAYLGAISWSGDYECYLRYAEMATALYGTLGDKGTPSTTTGVTTHTITPVDTTALPWYGVEEMIANEFEVMNFWDAKFNSLHFEADANGYLMGTFGLVARRGEAGFTETDLDALWDNTPMTVGTNITVSYNGVTLPAKSFSLDIANNLEDDDFRLGSFLLGDVTEKRREITANVTLRPTSSALWRQAVYGTGASTAPGGIVTKEELIITLASYEDIAGGTPATKNSVTLTIPKAALKPFNVDRSGDDVVEHSIDIECLRPDTADPIITAVVVEGAATIA